MANSAAPSQGNHLLFLGGLIAGGLILGFGIRSLYWSFGMKDNCLNCDFSTVGFNGIDNIALLGASNYSIGMVVLGALLMIFCNAFAWRETGGY